MKKPLSNYWNRKRRAYILKYGLKAWNRHLSSKRRKKFRQTPRGKYRHQLEQAKARGIEWLFTFESWFAVWKESGKWEERGKHKGQYQMARIGDCGPYAEWNVVIARMEANAVAAMMRDDVVPRLTDSALRAEVRAIL